MEAPGTSDPDPITCLELSSSGLLHYCTDGETEVARGTGSCHSSHTKGLQVYLRPHSRTLLYIKWDLGERPQFLPW